MKKIISMLIVATLVFSLASCSGGSDGGTTATETTTAAPGADLGTTISAKVSEAFSTSEVTTETAYLESSNIVNVKVTYSSIDSLSLSVITARDAIHSCLLSVAPMTENFDITFSIYFPLSDGDSTRVMYLKYTAETRHKLTEKNFVQSDVYKRADTFVSNEAIRDYL
ncbi:MAG: hypothetical protein GX051_04615 [Clostridiales bacterium]|nr:hypothetical protein [Clostridiales bacterium]